MQENEEASLWIHTPHMRKTHVASCASCGHIVGLFIHFLILPEAGVRAELALYVEPQTNSLPGSMSAHPRLHHVWCFPFSLCSLVAFGYNNALTSITPTSNINL